jgi:hypothetical protein
LVPTSSMTNGHSTHLTSRDGTAIPNLRAYADELKVTSDQVSCSHPSRTKGTAKLTGCTKTVDFKFYLNDSCSGRVVKAATPITTAKACANMCVEDGNVVKLIAFNFNCFDMSCEW